MAASSTEIYALIVRNDGSIKYLKRTGALWSSAIDISIGTLMTFSASPKGGFHIVYEVICGASKCAVGATRKVVHRFIASNGSISGETNLIDDANLGNVDRAGAIAKNCMSTDIMANCKWRIAICFNWLDTGRSGFQDFLSHARSI